MLDDDSPGFGVTFEIDGGASIAEVTRLAAVVDSAEAKMLRQFADLEKASNGVIKLGNATAEVKTFGMAATKELARTAAAVNQTEKEIDKLVSKMDREANAIGKTRDELRSATVERLALTASMQGNTDGYDRVFASARRLKAAQDALAQDQSDARTRAENAALREREAAEKAVIAQMRQRAELEVLLEKNFSVNRTSATQGGATFSALAEREREAELAERAVKADREQILLLGERAQLEAAIARTMGANRPRATDAGATFSALAAKAADDEARANAAAAAAAKQLADEHARLAAMVQASHDAQLADAAAAERLRETTDPLYAATKRLNAEIAESTRLYHVGATAPVEYARQQDVLNRRLQEVTVAHGAAAKAANGNAFALKQVAVQMPDVVQGLLTGQRPMDVIIQQGGQLTQIAMMAEGGLKAMATQVGLLALRFAPLAVVAGVAWGAIKLFQSDVADSKELTRYRDGLGLTHKEMLKLTDGVEKAGGKIKELGNVTVTTGDVISGLWQTVKDTAKPPMGDWSGFRSGAVEAFREVLETWNVVAAGITAGIVGTANAAKVIWQNFAGAVGDYFYQAVNFAITAMNGMVKRGTDLLNNFIHAANKLPGLNIGDVAAPQIAEVANPYAGAASQNSAAAAAKAIGDGYTKAYGDARKADTAFWHQVGVNARQSAKDRMKDEADAIKAGRTPHKPKVDHHAEQLAREAEAIERQIANLYKLADAYGVSGAAALIAEARVRAESKAVKQRADIEAAVAREIRLEIAQRVSDAAKGAAAMRDQAAMQEQVNAAVADGNVSAARAGDLMRDRMADLPLLAALQAAQMSGDAKGAEAAEKALDDQRAARDRLTDAERQALLLQATTAGKDRLAELQEELRLVGATDRARVVALATLKATQEAEANGWTGQKAADYIKQQAKIADQQQTLTENQNAWNASLGDTAELFDEIDRSVQSAASGMADAFGDVGRAIGDAASIMTGYYAEQASLQKDHDAAIRAAGANQAAIDHENQIYALRTATMRIGAYGDMTAAAKGFFKQGSAGFKAMGAAEKAFRAIELAMALKNAAVQVGLIGGVTAARTVATGTGIAADTAYTAASIANSGARATADATAAMAKTAASSPFPFNLAGMAVMAAALASIGLATGFFGGGGKNTLAKANDGSGTVLGDATAKSESLKRAIEQLRDVDTVTSTFARQMASSLRSIDDQIGGFAAQIARADGVDASAGVDVGFKTNAVGSVLKAIVPVFGGALASLFGTKTTVLASGLYGKAQSVGDILAGGFDASTYSDIEKKKKFFGITTSTKYSTQYGAADSGLENQFTLILRSFSTAIAAAAGPLGEATDAVQSRINCFVVDIGKIDLKGLTGAEIQEKLEAVFGTAADNMAEAAFPGIARFQKAGEGAFETLVRVSSTLEAVSTSLDLLGDSARGLGVDAKLGIADQFDSIGDLTSAADAYFTTFYSKAEQSAARAAQMTKTFDGLGLAMPATLDAFRHLVEAQDLTTTSGQSTYAALLRLAPAFADLASAMDGAKSAADVASEREDLERRLLELNGDTAAIRAAALAKLDASNRALQQQIYAIEDAQEAAKAAEQLREAWTSVGDGIMDEVKRIRGLTDAGDGGSFADLLSQFNAANAAARAGDMDIAKTLPALSQALLGKASDVATSRQELARVQAQTAAALEATYGVIGSLSAPRSTSTNAQLTAAADSQGGPTAIAANDDTADELRALREEVAGMRRDNNAGHAATASNTGRIDRKLEDVTAASGGAAISVTSAAA